MSAESVQASRTRYAAIVSSLLSVVLFILLVLEAVSFLEFVPKYGSVSNSVYWLIVVLALAIAGALIMLRVLFTLLAEKKKVRGEIFAYKKYSRFATLTFIFSVVMMYSMSINLLYEYRKGKITQLPEVQMAAQDVDNPKEKLEQLIASPPASQQAIAQAESLQSSLTTEKEVLASTMQAKKAQFWQIQDRSTGLQFGEITNASCIDRTGNHKTRAKAICNEYKNRFESNTKIASIEQKLSENKLILSWSAQKSELQDAIATAETKYVALIKGENGEGYPQSLLLFGQVIGSVTRIDAVTVTMVFYYALPLIILVILLWAQSNSQIIMEDLLASDSRSGGRTFIQEAQPVASVQNRFAEAYRVLKGQSMVKPNDDMDYPLVVAEKKVRKQKPKEDDDAEVTTSNPIGFTSMIEKKKPKQALTTTKNKDNRQDTLF